MQDLTPVGLSEDGSRLILVSDSGEEFSVAADARLRAALRGNPTDQEASPPSARPLERQMESALRPRDIQARIRAGESTQDVAAAAGTSVEAIMGFATPVLAERAHVAQTAQRASVRRSGESAAAGRTLWEAAETYFAEHGLHDEDVKWDAWRRPDGRWALVAEYAVTGSPRRAEFTHDLPGRYVLAENDDARRLTGELREQAPAEAASAGPARRLSSVPAQDELPLGDDALELVRDRQPGDQPAPQPAVEEPDDTEDNEDTAPVEPRPVEAEPAEEPEAPVAEGAEAPVAESAEAPVAESAEVEPEPSPGPKPGSPKGRPAGRKKGRASVPSWDEIMFGGGGGPND